MDLSCILLVLTVILITYWYLTKNYDYWEKQNIPSIPNPIPGFGNLLPIITLYDSIYSFTNRAYESYKSSMVGFYFMRRPALIVRDPELVKSVLQTNFSSFRSNVISFSEKQDPILFKNPFFTSDPVQWKERRIQLINNLTGKKLRYLYVIIEKVCSKMSDYLDGKIVEHEGQYECNLKILFSKCTGEVVANAAFGIEGESFHDKPHKEAFTNTAAELFIPNFWNGIKQTIIFFLPNLASFLRIKFMSQHTENFFRTSIQTIVEQRKNQNTTPNDFLQFCLDSNKGNKMNEVIADLVSFYLDVYETSSAVISQVCYYLSLNKDIQTKLRDDIVIKLKNKPLSYETLKEMNYLDQVLNESMRHTAPLAVQMKICTEEITLTGPDGLKCLLKPGYPVFIPNMDLHRDEKYWPNTNVFDPERFNPENQNSNTKFAFIPFGEGPRICIGMRLGMMLVKTAMTTILTGYSIEPSTKTKIPLEIDSTTIVSSYKGGLWAKFQKIK